MIDLTIHYIYDLFISNAEFNLDAYKILLFLFLFLFFFFLKEIININLGSGRLVSPENFL